MTIARALVENHGKIAAIVFPLSIAGGFAYTMATGNSPVPVRSEQSAEGEGFCQTGQSPGGGGVQAWLAVPCVASIGLQRPSLGMLVQILLTAACHGAGRDTHYTLNFKLGGIGSK